MNIGLVRQFFLASHTVMREYLYEGTSTYRTAYNVLNDRWFPVVPTREGLVWSKADRALRMLDDAEARQVQAAARREVDAFASLLTAAEPVPRDRVRARVPAVLETLPHLSLDAAAGQLTQMDPAVFAELGILEPLRAVVEKKTRQSHEAFEFLAQSITADDEWALSLLTGNLAAAGYSNRERLNEETNRLGEAERGLLLARVAELESLYLQY